MLDHKFHHTVNLKDNNSNKRIRSYKFGGTLIREWDATHSHRYNRLHVFYALSFWLSLLWNHNNFWLGIVSYYSFVGEFPRLRPTINLWWTYQCTGRALIISGIFLMAAFLSRKWSLYHKFLIWGWTKRRLGFGHLLLCFQCCLFYGQCLFDWEINLQWTTFRIRATLLLYNWFQLICFSQMWYY